MGIFNILKIKWKIIVMLIIVPKKTFNTLKKNHGYMFKKITRSSEPFTLLYLHPNGVRALEVQLGEICISFRKVNFQCILRLDWCEVNF
jgi:hypothetical protein